MRDYDTGANGFLEKENQESENDAKDFQNFAYDIAERFLFETEAILALQTSVQAFVYLQGLSKCGTCEDLSYSLRLRPRLGLQLTFIPTLINIRSFLDTNNLNPWARVFERVETYVANAICSLAEGASPPPPGKTRLHWTCVSQSESPWYFANFPYLRAFVVPSITLLCGAALEGGHS